MSILEGHPLLVRRFPLLLLSAIILFHVTLVEAAERKALVIGNAKYETNQPLANPVRDAHDVADVLKRVGFSVRLLTDARLVDLTDAVQAFGESLREGDTALLYYSGHGIQAQGRNFIIPTNAKITAEQNVRLQAIDIEAILDQMAYAKTAVNIVILDACRNNPFEERLRGGTQGLAQMTAPKGTIIAYATAPGKTASDGRPGANGIYTAALLKAIETPGLTIEETLKRVRVSVMDVSNGHQIPWDASSLTGDFRFIDGPSDTSPSPALPAGTNTDISMQQDGRPSADEAAQTASLPAAPATSPPSPDGIAVENALWQEIKDAYDWDQYADFLQRFPDGAFAGLARQRQKKMIGDVTLQAAATLWIGQSAHERLDSTAYRRSSWINVSDVARKWLPKHDFLHVPAVRALLERAVGVENYKAMQGYVVGSPVKNDLNFVVLGGCKPSACGGGQDFAMVISLRQDDYAVCVSRQVSPGKFLVTTNGADGKRQEKRVSGMPQPCAKMVGF
ncbi:caspase family protein [Azospirillum palustre]|uniref:caspase family protein n=1 Tax=Azospirillum palustre TaxID=2044885 RepID=UPI00137B6199|nr:caspase family protein [Azospirillum palustre]